MANEEDKGKDPVTRTNTEVESRDTAQQKRPEPRKDVLRTNTEIDSRDTGDKNSKEDKSSSGPPDTTRGQ